MSHKPQFEKLFQSGRIGNLDIKNRYVVPPLATNLASADGYVSDKMKAYYAERARGGFGLIIVENACIQPPLGNTVARELGIDDDKYVPGLKDLATVIKDNGARVGIQLHHAGRAAKARFTHMQPVAPSPIPMPPYSWGGSKVGDMPRELTIAEIEDIVSRFAQGSIRARKAGFELVEIHGASGYLIAQFLSAVSNRRQDGYGGELRNRARLVLEIIAAIKEAVGKDFPVTLRLNGREFGVQGGFTLDEAKQVARWAEGAGIDAIHQSVFVWGLTAKHVPPMAEPDGSVMRLAAGLKEAVAVPVVAAGRMTPTLGEQVLTEGQADFISVGRGSLADPYIPNKVAQGRAEDIAPCIGCLHCIDCIQQKDKDVACSVNGALGHEAEYSFSPAIKGKRVVVVGGGPAGLEAARVAAAKGHQVTLFEKGHKLGGQLLLAEVPPHKARIGEFRAYLERQVRKARIDIVLGREVTVREIADMKPDAVVVATGAKPLIPQISGAERANVVTAEDVLSGKATGNNVVIVGGDLWDCETAEFLLEQGKQVTVTRRGPRTSVSMNHSLSTLQLARLNAKGFSLLTCVKWEEITQKGLIITNVQGQRQTIEADTIVLAAGAVPQSGLAKPLKDEVAEVYSIGDCVKPRTIVVAVAEGARAGYRL